jgi:dihydroorotase
MIGGKMRFDLVLKGGEVVDPAAGYHGKMDVAVKRDRIAAVEPNIPAESAFKVIDATGQYVTPGLIDMHAHIYQGATYWAVDPDAIGSQSGVTTWVDAGSPGAITLQGFRDHVVNTSKVKIYTFVNISYIGLVAQDYELSNPEYCNIEILERVVPQHSDIVVGLKLRAGRSGAAQDLQPFERVRQAADDLQLPVMIHLSTPPPSVETVLEYLKPGDIITHCFTGQGMKIVDDNGQLLDAVKQALDEGLIMDLGHGAGSFSFETAEALVGQGIYPDVISTDLHQMSLVGHKMIDPLKGSAFGDLSETTDARSIVVQVEGEWEPALDLLLCMDKLMHVGMSFEDVLRATTSRPAEVLGLEGQVGTLAPGAYADIATFVMEPGDYELWDIHGNVRHGKQKIRNITTILNGRVFDRIDIPGPPPWIQPVGK